MLMAINAIDANVVDVIQLYAYVFSKIQIYEKQLNSVGEKSLTLKILNIVHVATCN